MAIVVAVEALFSENTLVFWIHFVGTSGVVEFLNDHSSTCNVWATIVQESLIVLLQVYSPDVVRRSYLKNALYDVLDCSEGVLDRRGRI